MFCLSWAWDAWTETGMRIDLVHRQRALWFLCLRSQRDTKVEKLRIILELLKLKRRLHWDLVHLIAQEKKMRHRRNKPESQFGVRQISELSVRSKWNIFEISFLILLSSGRLYFTRIKNSVKYLSAVYLCQLPTVTASMAFFGCY